MAIQLFLVIKIWLRVITLSLVTCCLGIMIPETTRADFVDEPLDDEVAPGPAELCARNGGFYFENICWDSYEQYQCLSSEPVGEYIWVLGGLCYWLPHWQCEQNGFHWFDGRCYETMHEANCVAAGLSAGCTERMLHCVALGFSPECSDADFYEAACNLGIHPDSLPADECCEFYGGVWFEERGYCAHDLTEIECLEMGLDQNCEEIPDSYWPTVTDSPKESPTWSGAWSEVDGTPFPTPVPTVGLVEEESDPEGDSGDSPGTAPFPTGMLYYGNTYNSNSGSLPGDTAMPTPAPTSSG